MLSRLGVDHDVSEVGNLLAELLLELAGQQMSSDERLAGIEACADADGSARLDRGDVWA